MLHPFGRAFIINFNLSCSFLIESGPILPNSNLPPKVPHFTGREKECSDIIDHVTSESTRLVSVWGSPGFGKTSIAIAVGHQLKAQGLPVYFISLRGLRLKSDLTSKLLGFFSQSATLSQRLTADDELCSIFDQLSDRCVCILDNVDDLIESGIPNVKEDVVHLIEEILNRSNKVKFLLTTRESFEFFNLRFQGHHAVRIRELDEQFSRYLVKELLPESCASDCVKVSQICGNVPLAMKLLCSSISEDCSGQPSHYIDMFKNTTDNILQELDNSDYPSNMRLKCLFDASFQRLSPKEREGLVSFCVLPEHFDLTVAAAVLGMKTIDARKILQTLQRKSLIDSSCKSEKYSIHKLLLTFVMEKGQLELKETFLNSKARFYEFYISLFEKLTEEFLTGSSMSAFIEFFQNEKSIVESLIDGCSDSRTVDKVCNVLAKAELYLYFIYWNNTAILDIIYDSAIKAANDHHGKNCVYKRLLLSKAYGGVIMGSSGETEKLLSEAREIQLSASIRDREQEGKLLSYHGLYQLVIGRTEGGLNLLEEALSFLVTSSEHTILKIIVCQILAFYHSLKSNPLQSLKLYKRAVVECRAVGDKGLLVIPAIGKTTTNSDEDNTPSNKTRNAHNQPLEIEVIYVVSQAVKNITTNETEQCFHSLLLQILKESESALPPGATGRFNYHYSGVRLLNKMRKREGSSVDIHEIMNFHSKTIEGNFNKKNSKTSQKNRDHSKVDNLEAVESNKRALDIRLKVFGEEHSVTAASYDGLAVIQHSLGDCVSALESQHRALDIRLKVFGEEHSETARSYHSLGKIQHSLGDFVSALESKKRALEIRLKVLGEEHSESALSYHEIGATQHSLGDFVSALESEKRALDIRLKVFSGEHSVIATRYHGLGVIQHSLGDFVSALESHNRALDIRLKVFGEEHSETATSYDSLGVTQHSLEEFVSALESKKHALDIRLKVLGEEHSDTAYSYHSLGVTQHLLRDFVSGLESNKRALDIRLKVFGEEHSETATSYHSLGATQHSLGDFVSALESKKRALDIRLKVFGEEHSETALSYHEIGVTQHSLGDFVSALESDKRALDIRLKVLGEEHSETATSYDSLGDTQHSLGDFISALESNKRVLDIRLKVLGEEHSETAASYHSLGVTQHSLGDFVSALESDKRALDIRLKVFGEEHSETALIYHEIGVTQHSLGDFVSALESDKRALDIRLKVFGEEHSETATSYHSLGVTQHSLADFVSALESHKRALDIRLKVLGEEHSEIARSYHLLGVTQHSLGDFVSALQSHKRALDIQLKVFGEEHSETATSYHWLGVTQHSLGDFVSALQSHKRALDIRLKVFGEEHSETATSYHWLGVTQHSLGDFVSALQSHKRALDIRLKVLGEEHSEIARSYHLLGVTQHSLGDFVSAHESLKRALDIRLKVLGE